MRVRDAGIEPRTVIGYFTMDMRGRLCGLHNNFHSFVRDAGIEPAAFTMSM